MKGAYYNEHDPNAARWLRELIREGLIADGEVDERSIRDVEADDLRRFAQCHFFAGIGVWSYALRRAGWPDDEPVWTGSCPCQPFSSAGKQLGFEDPRHLWPAWLRLIGERRPHRIFGEQVDSADAWLDLVSSDLESHGYAFGSTDLPAAGFGGAHIRQRFFWVADADNAEWWSERAPWHDGEWPQTGRIKSDRHGGERGALGRLGDAGGIGSPAVGRDPGEVRGLQKAQRQSEHGSPISGGPVSLVRVEHTDIPGCGRLTSIRLQRAHVPDADRWREARVMDADWLWCADDLWRPVEPGTSPLAHQAPARMGRLRGYGNAIDAETAATFIGAYMAAAPCNPPPRSSISGGLCSINSNQPQQTGRE